VRNSDELWKTRAAGKKISGLNAFRVFFPSPSFLHLKGMQH